MKQFIAKSWNLIARAKIAGFTQHQIHLLLVKGGFPGSFRTFSTYCQQVSKMNPEQRGRFARS